VTRIRTAVSLIALAILLVSMLWLARLEATGPERLELQLDGGVPATLYLPFAAGEAAGQTASRGSASARPPAVVLAHGFASDRRGMSVLARAFTQAGYAVLTLDFRGHGENRNPFGRRGARAESLFADLSSAVNFLRTFPDVDGGRISVMGHSMGAHAALEYAGFDPALDATVMISGGRRADGPQRPANALFIYGAGDPARIRDRSAALVAELASGEAAAAAEGVVFGSFRDSTAVSHVEVAKADHITILSSSYAARQIIDWLDQSYGVERGTFFLRSDPRLSAAGIGMLALLALLPGLGALIARLAPRLAERPGTGAAGRLGLLGVALLGTLPLVAVGGSERIVPLVVANTVVVHLFGAGAALMVWLVVRGQFEASALRVGTGATVGAAAVGLVAVGFSMTPFGVVLHGLGLTPERAAVAVLVTALLVPFQLVFHDFVRRGSTLGSTVVSSLGRILILGVLVLAVQTGVLSGVVMLMMPVLVLLFVLFEVLSSAIYANSRNHVVPALLESGWLAWIFSAVLPIAV
jgi:dienelactone hydrolase